MLFPAIEKGNYPENIRTKSERLYLKAETIYSDKRKGLMYMELKDIFELVMEHAVEAIVFVLLLAIFCSVFFEGGMTNMIQLFGTSLYGA